jgi:acyl-CoA synthetase (AMP-forming)/AMP-acid ligase II
MMPAIPLACMSNRDLSLVDVLVRRALTRREDELYRFCRSPESEPEILSYAELDRQARAVAQRIRERVPLGGRVLLLCDFGATFPIAFFACLYAGVTAIPAYPPDGTRSVAAIERVRHIVHDAAPQLVITSSPMNAEILEREPTLAEIDSMSLSEAKLDELDARHWRRPDGLEDGVAFLQYSSGSTRAPRGVVITHANLQKHQERAHEVFQSPEGSTTVSWLPFYHDMGLIGSMLYPLFCGGQGVFLPPTSFLRRPMWWLRCISEFGARTSTAPNFAYDLCTRRAKDEEVAQLDLSSWEITVCGAEPVRANTMQRFIERFGPAGFRPQTFLPCFGLAEATLVGTAPSIHDVPAVHYFDELELRRGRLVPVDQDHEGAEEHVACGRPTREHEVAIVDPETRERLAPGTVGEIWLRGPSMSHGYFGRAAESRRLLNAEIEGETHEDRRWARTGDVGAQFDDELFVLGRLADVVRINDEDWAPQVVEAAINDDRPRGVAGDAVFFQPEAGSAAYLACETRKLADDELAHSLCEQLAARVLERTGVELDHVLLLPPRTVAKTSSGKLRRYRYRDAFVQQELPLRYQWTRGERSDGTDAGPRAAGAPAPAL